MYDINKWTKENSNPIEDIISFKEYLKENAEIELKNYLKTKEKYEKELAKIFLEDYLNSIKPS